MGVNNDSKVFILEEENEIFHSKSLYFDSQIADSYLHDDIISTVKHLYVFNPTIQHSDEVSRKCCMVGITQFLVQITV